MLKWLFRLFGRHNDTAKASPQKEHIERLISQHERRLQILKEQQASDGQGVWHVPAHILIEIEDVETEIQRLERGVEDENYGGRDQVEAVLEAHRRRLQKLKKLETNSRQPVSSEEIAAIELELQRLQAELKSK
jgi:hypothetical protein